MRLSEILFLFAWFCIWTGSDSLPFSPSAKPTSPTSQPSSYPSYIPSSSPSGYPSSQPSMQPSNDPSTCPSTLPSSSPTIQPSNSPSAFPSSQPSMQPSQPSSQPTSNPSLSPTIQPSRQPTQQPFEQPSSSPTVQPSSQPSRQPVSRPSRQPSSQPTSSPSLTPTVQPSRQPTRQPSAQPSSSPTVQPSSQPSCQPVTRPSRQPTRQPSAQPSRQPSRQPSSVPSRQPSSQPSTHPSHSPSACPSSQPSIQPSRQPFSLPTSTPSTQPSSQPSVYPTSLPTEQPTSQPSIQPSMQPTSHPTMQPSCMPSHQPTSQPSASPTKQPSSLPTTQPSTQPTDHPSLQPFSVPSSLPSTQPTSSPSEVPDCPKGYHYEFTGIDGAAQCLACPHGYYAPPKSHECSIAPQGHYAPVNASEPFLCPGNTYSESEGAFTCTKCAPGLVNTGLGNFDPKQCVNPQVSFGIAFFGLVVCWVGIVLYILGGRLHRMAFIRREVLVRRASMMFNIVCDQLLTLNRQYTEQAIVKKHNKTKYTVIKILYYTLAWTIVIGFVLMFFIASLFEVFFTALVLFRGYVSLPEIALPDLFGRYMEYIQNFQVPYLDDIFYPFLYALEVMASFNVTLESVSVSCIGAQIPMHLLVDCFVIGIVILVIESNVEVFWCTALTNVMEEYQKLILHPHFWKGRYCSNFIYFCWSVVVLCLPHPRKIIQYSLGFVSIGVFFNTNYHANHSPNCDIAYSKIGTMGVDSMLALIASIIAYAAICPLIYIFAQILVPEFKLDPGTVRPEKYIRKRVHAMAEKIICCPKCHLGLIAHMTDHFGTEFHCDATNCVHKDEAGVPLLDAILLKTQTVYGCPCYQTCNWAICVDCYSGCMQSAASEKKRTISNAGGSTKSYDTRAMTPQDAEDGRVSPATVGGAAGPSGKDVTIIEIEKDKRFYSSSTRYGKLIAMLGAIDWFYVRFAYAFALRIANALAIHIVEMRIELDPESQKSPPDLPWFVALDDSTDEAEKLRQEEEWTKVSSSFPSYYRLCLTVQDDLMPKMVHHGICCNRCGTMPIVGHRYTATDEGPEYNLCEHCECATMKDDVGRTIALHQSSRTVGRNCLRYLIAAFSITTIGQLCSTRGRLIWRRVIINYYVFFMVIFGYWNRIETRDYQLKQWFAWNQKENAVIYHEAKTFDESPYLNTSKKQTENSKVISALVSPRLVLLQLLPYMTVVSTFAVDVSSAPLLVFDPRLKGEILPMIQWKNADKIAKEFLREVGASRKIRNVQFMTFYVIFTKSRLIQFFVSAVTNFIAVALVFTPSPHVVGVFTFSTVFFFLISMVYALYPFILLDRLLFPPEEGEVFDEEEMKKREEGVHGSGEHTQEEHQPTETVGEVAPQKRVNNFDGITTEQDDENVGNEGRMNSDSGYRIENGCLTKIVPSNGYNRRYGTVG